jgi:hypothetical protein
MNSKLSGRKGIVREIAVAFSMDKVVFTNTNPTQNTTLPIAHQENGCKFHRLHIVQLKIQYALCHLQPFSWLRLAHAPERAKGLSEKYHCRKYRGKAATSHNEGLARWRHYLAWKDICYFRGIARVENVLEAATAPSCWDVRRQQTGKKVRKIGK